MTPDKNEKMVSVSVSIKKQENVANLNKILPGTQVYALASVIKIVRLVNTWKTVNA